MVHRGTYVVHTWSTRGTYVVHTWSTRGTHVVHTWYIRGPRVVHTWYIRGPRVVHTWYIRGPRVVHTWSTRGTYVEVEKPSCVIKKAEEFLNFHLPRFHVVFEKLVDLSFEDPFGKLKTVHKIWGILEDLAS